MNSLKTLFFVGLLLLINTGCFENKTLLSEEVKSINPYRVGQQVIFISSFGDQDTIRITKVESGRFPDGIGSPNNERMVINAFRMSTTVKSGVEIRILTLLAEDSENDEEIDFDISLRDTRLQMGRVSLTSYLEKDPFIFSTDYHNYNDVLMFDNNSDRVTFDTEVVRFYWSKSKGYVRLIQKNGQVWDLKSIE